MTQPPHRRLTRRRGRGCGRSADRRWPGLQASPAPRLSARRAVPPGGRPAGAAAGTGRAPRARPATATRSPAGRGWGCRGGSGLIRPRRRRCGPSGSRAPPLLASPRPARRGGRGARPPASRSRAWVRSRPGRASPRPAAGPARRRGRSSPYCRGSGGDRRSGPAAAGRSPGPSGRRAAAGRWSRCRRTGRRRPAAPPRARA